MTLSEMKRVAEQHLGREIDERVLAVAAFFNGGQRQAIENAGLGTPTATSAISAP